MSEAAEILAKEMQAIVAADRWKGRDLSAAPPEKWSHLRAETQQFWIDTASRILATIQPADLVQAKDAEIAKLSAELATLRASEARLREALLGLEKAATEVSRYGAQTGSQWSRLTVANLRALAALTPPADMAAKIGGE